MVIKLFELLEKSINPTLVVVLAALARLVPHMPNFAPIGAMALFGGAYLGKKWAIAVPLAAMVISDIFIGFDGISSRITVYGTFILIGLIGLWLRNKKSITNVILASFTASVLFFLTTNFGVWAFGNIYAKSFAGLVECYVAAIPFFRGTLLGDLFYTGVFFGGYELALRIVKINKLALQERIK